MCGHHNIYFVSQALVVPEKFQHILRVLNTNIDGKQKIMFALTAIKVSRKNSYLQFISFTIRIMLLEWKPSLENFWFWFEVRKMVSMSCWCEVWCVRVQLNQLSCSDTQQCVGKLWYFFWWYILILILSVPWCFGNYCWLALVLWFEYWSLSFQFFVLHRLVITPVHNTKKLS